MGRGKCRGRVRDRDRGRVWLGFRVCYGRIIARVGWRFKLCHECQILDAIKLPAGKWGTAAKCDLPFITFDSAMKHISAVEKVFYKKLSKKNFSLIT